MRLRYVGAGPEVVPVLGGMRVSPDQVVKVPARLAPKLRKTGRWVKADQKPVQKKVEKKPDEPEVKSTVNRSENRKVFIHKKKELK